MCECVCVYACVFVCLLGWEKAVPDDASDVKGAGWLTEAVTLNPGGPYQSNASSQLSNSPLTMAKRLVVSTEMLALFFFFFFWRGICTATQARALWYFIKHYGYTNVSNTTIGHARQRVAATKVMQKKKMRRQTP